MPSHRSGAHRQTGSIPTEMNALMALHQAATGGGGTQDGGASSGQSPWMDVPFLTRRGDRFVSRVGESIAHNARLPDWIVPDDDEYVAKAVAFASDLEALAGLRAGLREQVLASPLFDAPRFARNLEDALWVMWKDAGRSNNKASCLA